MHVDIPDWAVAVMCLVCFYWLIMFTMTGK